MVIVSALAFTTAPPASASSVPFQRLLLAKINTVRVSHGLTRLLESSGLQAAAEQHSLEMARDGYFGHQARNGAPFAARIRRFYGTSGQGSWAAGENLVWGAPNLAPNNAVRVWLASLRHRENLLNPNWREIGFGVVHAHVAPGVYGGRSATIVTVDFGVRS